MNPAIPDESSLNIKILAHCPHCGIERLIDSTDYVHQPFQRLVVVCPNCEPVEQPKRAMERPKLTRDELIAIEWCKYCPTEFRLTGEGAGATVADRVQPCVDFVRDNTKDCYSVLLYGATGSMKTRTLWRLIHEHFRADEKLEVFSCARFASGYQAAAGAYRADDFLKQMESCGLFAVDDLCKFPWTANVWSAFFEVIGQRQAWRRATILTCNFDIPAIAHFMEQHQSPEVRGMAGPLTRRLTDGFKSLKLSEK